MSCYARLVLAEEYRQVIAMSFALSQSQTQNIVLSSTSDNIKHALADSFIIFYYYKNHTVCKRLKLLTITKLPEKANE